MNKNVITTTIIILLLAFSGYISWNFYFKEYNAADTVNIHLFPKTIGEWESTELVVTEKEKAILETDNVFVRNYLTKSGKKVQLFIVYSQSNRKVSHPPEVCYTGGGISILEKKKTPLQTGETNFNAIQMLMEQGPNKQYVYYWFKVGDSFTPNYWQQQLLIATKSLLKQPSSSALIRVSAYIGNNGGEKAKKDVEEFIQLIQPELATYLP